MQGTKFAIKRVKEKSKFKHFANAAPSIISVPFQYLISFVSDDTFMTKDEVFLRFIDYSDCSLISSDSLNGVILNLQFNSSHVLSDDIDDTFLYNLTKKNIVENEDDLEENQLRAMIVKLVVIRNKDKKWKVPGLTRDKETVSLDTFKEEVNTQSHIANESFRIFNTNITPFVLGGYVYSPEQGNFLMESLKKHLLEEKKTQIITILNALNGELQKKHTQLGVLFMEPIQNAQSLKTLIEQNEEHEPAEQNETSSRNKQVFVAPKGKVLQRVTRTEESSSSSNDSDPINVLRRNNVSDEPNNSSALQVSQVKVLLPPSLPQNNDIREGISIAKKFKQRNIFLKNYARFLLFRSLYLGYIHLDFHRFNFLYTDDMYYDFEYISPRTDDFISLPSKLFIIDWGQAIRVSPKTLQRVKELYVAFVEHIFDDADENTNILDDFRTSILDYFTQYLLENIINHHNYGRDKKTFAEKIREIPPKYSWIIMRSEEDTNELVNIIAYHRYSEIIIKKTYAKVIEASKKLKEDVIELGEERLRNLKKIGVVNVTESRPSTTNVTRNWKSIKKQEITRIRNEQRIKKEAEESYAKAAKAAEDAFAFANQAEAENIEAEALSRQAQSAATSTLASSFLSSCIEKANSIALKAKKAKEAAEVAAAETELIRNKGALTAAIADVAAKKVEEAKKSAQKAEGHAARAAAAVKQIEVNVQYKKRSEDLAAQRAKEAAEAAAKAKRQQEIYNAISYVDDSVFLKLLEQGVDLNHVYTNFDNNTLLIEAARRNKVEITLKILSKMQSLTGAGEFINHANSDHGDTALHWWVHHGNLTMILTFCIYPEINVNKQNKLGYTPLMIAVKNGASLQIVSALIEYNTDINLTDTEGKTALHILVENWQKVEEISQGHLVLLIKAGISIDATDRIKNTALHYAVKNLHLSAVSGLLIHNADRNIIGEGNLTPMGLLAVKRGHFGIRSEYLTPAQETILNEMDVEFTGIPHRYNLFEYVNEVSLETLFRWRADTTQKNKSGQSILHIAILEKNLKALKIIIKFNSAYLQQTEPIDKEIFNIKKGPFRKHAYFETLIELGILIDPNGLDNMRMTPLLYLIKQRWMEGAEAFITGKKIPENYVDYVDLNYEGAYHPFNYTVQGNREYDDILNFLIEKGTEIKFDFLTKDSETPFILTVKNTLPKLFVRLYNLARESKSDILKLSHKDAQGGTALDWASDKEETIWLVPWIVTLISISSLSPLDKYNLLTKKWVANTPFMRLLKNIDETKTYNITYDTAAKIVSHYITTVKDIKRQLPDPHGLRQSIEKIESIDKILPIHIACQRGLNSIVEILLKLPKKEWEKEWLRDVGDSTGNTPLHYASMYGHEAVVRTLLNYGAKSKQNRLGQLPITVICKVNSCSTRTRENIYYFLSYSRGGRRKTRNHKKPKKRLNTRRRR